MGLEIIVTSSEPEEGIITLPEGGKLRETLGDEEKVSVQIRELLGTIFDEVRQSVDVECNLEAQVSGKVTLSGKGEAKFLIFNIGGGVSTETSMSIKLSAKISPKELHE